MFNYFVIYSLTFVTVIFTGGFLYGFFFGVKRPELKAAASDAGNVKLSLPVKIDLISFNLDTIIPTVYVPLESLVVIIVL
jgi:hypothetical protein